MADALRCRQPALAPWPIAFANHSLRYLSPASLGARFADLCAGSGAVGIEALSRGAAHALFVERSRDAVAIIQANLTTLKLTERATLQGADVLVALNAPGA